MSYRANDLVRTMTGKIGHVREILPDSIVRVAIIVRIPNDHAPSPALSNNVRLARVTTERLPKS